MQALRLQGMVIKGHGELAIHVRVCCRFSCFSQVHRLQASTNRQKNLILPYLSRASVNGLKSQQ